MWSEIDDALVEVSSGDSTIDVGDEFAFSSEHSSAGRPLSKTFVSVGGVSAMSGSADCVGAAGSVE